MALYSMTGYAAGERDLGAVRLALELKSVNGRFLDLSLRAADELRFLEMPLREKIAAAIGRGKLDCRLHLLPGNAAPQFTPNFALVEALARLDQEIRAVLPAAAPLSVAEVLRWPGVLAAETINAERLKVECLDLFEEVLAEFLASRAREGARLGEVLLERLARMRTALAQVEPLVPAAISEYAERLACRLREAVAALDEERIRQEIGLFAAKIDVAEELARLAAHLDEVERVLAHGGAVGKRLDFLMQELNREANTLASKSVSAAITAIALELKLLIEQMREQVQNLE
ncbi:MAG: YicC family protein [Rhodocyclaceae bacterium]|nr:YicC family protein [Rhodocyclaceae bacterium]